MLAGIILLRCCRGLEIDGIALLACVTTQSDSLQPYGSFHDNPYIVRHLVFLLEPYHHQQLQLEVLQILGWFPHHVGLLGTELGRFDAGMTSPS
jgi:hypothetical protein